MNIEIPDFDEQMKKIDDKITEAEQNAGDIEVRDALVDKAELYLRAGDHNNYRGYLLKAVEKTAGSQKKLEFYLAILNSYYIHHDVQQFSHYLAICRGLNEEGGDWEKKNKLMVYEGIWSLMRRRLPEAAASLLGAVNTFNAPEVLSFETLVGYASILSLLTLPRREVKEKLISNSEIIGVLNENQVLSDFVTATFNSDHSRFFETLMKLDEKFFQTDRFLKPHRQHLLRRARIVIYAQYLESYKTVRLDKMAQDFGVSVDFIDRELSELISTRQLTCQIDKVNGIVESSKGDKRVEAYEEILKRGDALIERMHKLAKYAQV